MPGTGLDSTQPWTYHGLCSHRAYSPEGDYHSTDIRNMMRGTKGKVECIIQCIDLEVSERLP